MKYDIKVLIPTEGNDVNIFIFEEHFNAPRSQVLEILFGRFNHGSGEECQDFLYRKCRSLSVNDFVRLNGEWFQCRSQGWDSVTRASVKNQLAEAKALCGQGHGQVSMWSALNTLNQVDHKFEGSFKD